MDAVAFNTTCEDPAVAVTRGGKLPVSFNFFIGQALSIIYRAEEWFYPEAEVFGPACTKPQAEELVGPVLGLEDMGGLGEGYSRWR
jgi:hypothetical protein